MSDTDRIMLSAQVSTGSTLHEQFTEYQDSKGFESKSEAVRAAVRDGIEANREQEEAGPWSLLASVAGEQLTDQISLLGRYLLYTGVALLLVEFQIFAAPVWIGMAAVFGVLALATALSTLSTVGRYLTGDVPETPESAEVEA